MRLMLVDIIVFATALGIPGLPLGATNREANNNDLLGQHVYTTVLYIACLHHCAIYSMLTSLCYI